MELYRYLFTPVLVAVAVWSGHHQRRPVLPPVPPATVAPAALGPAAARAVPNHSGANPPPVRHHR